MTKKSSIGILVANCAVCLLSIVGTAVFLHNWGLPLLIGAYAFAGLGLAAGAVLLITKKEALFKTVFVFETCVLILTVAVILMNEIGQLDGYASDGEKLDRIVQMIRGSGKWGMLVFIVIQILQVVILPLPAVVCYVSGAQIWSPLLATVLASIGVIAGSVAAFYIGRLCGKRVVEWIVGKEATDKYTGIIGRRGKLPFIMMQILPFFPDDILCMVAGLSSMGFPFFILVTIIVRPAIIAVYCFMGSGLIPFSGWGIAVWAVIIAVCVVFAILFIKYQDRIENWFRRKTGKLAAASKTCENIGADVADKDTQAVENTYADDAGEAKKTSVNSAGKDAQVGKNTCADDAWQGEDGEKK